MGLSARHQSSRASDTGQAFAPADPSPSRRTYLSIKYSLPTPNLTAILLRADGSLRPGCPREMSLSCTVATTRDDESLRPRLVPILLNMLDKSQTVLPAGPHRPLRPRIKSKSSVSMQEFLRLSLTFYRTVPVTRHIQWSASSHRAKNGEPAFFDMIVASSSPSHLPVMRLIPGSLEPRAPEKRCRPFSHPHLMVRTGTIA